MTSTTAANPKERAAESALAHVRSGMVVGLGTGSTADCFLIALARELTAGRLININGIATSNRSESRARSLRIPLTDLASTPKADVTVDGADEIAPNLDLIKGLGGALLREKIVAQHSSKLIIIADASKLVARLGTHSPLPVEVARFAHETHENWLKTLGNTPVLRRNADRSPFVTDNGNYIYDCDFRPGGIADPAGLERQLRGRAGVVDSGLFLGMAELAIVAYEGDVRVITR